MQFWFWKVAQKHPVLKLGIKDVFERLDNGLIKASAPFEHPTIIKDKTISIGITFAECFEYHFGLIRIFKI